MCNLSESREKYRKRYEKKKANGFQKFKFCKRHFDNFHHLEKYFDEFEEAVLFYDNLIVSHDSKKLQKYPTDAQSLKFPRQTDKINLTFSQQSRAKKHSENE